MRLPNLYQRISADASVGTTIGTFDAIDTRLANNQLINAAKVLLGLSFAGAPADQTTGTACAGRLRYVNAGASIAQSEADFLVGASHGAGVATQSQGWWIPAEFIPYEVQGNIGNTTGNFSFSQVGIEPADNWSVVAGALHGAAIPPLWDWNVVGGLRPHGSASSNGAGVAAVTPTSLGSTTILAKYRRLIGWRPVTQADPLQTTTEECVGFSQLQGGASTIDNLDPQEHVMPSLGPALLGTLVGGGLDGFQPSLPMYVEVEGTADRVLDVTLILTTAVTAAMAFGYSVAVRRS
jgi:hypothetical protein